MSTTNDQKLAKFMQAINAYAEQQRDDILREVEAFKQERLGRAEQEVLLESYVLVQHEQDEVRREISRENSEKESAARQALLQKRARITEDIFARARQKLLTFTATPDYEKLLADSIQKITQQLPAAGTVFYLRRADEGLLNLLRPLCPADSRIELTDDIALGGVRGLNREAGMLIDDTLDARLDGQYRWFTDHAGLTIT